MKRPKCAELADSEWAGLALVAPTDWACDAGHTTEPMLAAATNTTAETIPIRSRGDNRMIGWRVGG
jgi:hypothetical protein